jgi:hypothetical protein
MIPNTKRPPRGLEHHLDLEDLHQAFSTARDVAQDGTRDIRRSMAGDLAAQALRAKANGTLATASKEPPPRSDSLAHAITWTAAMYYRRGRQQVRSELAKQAAQKGQSFVPATGDSGGAQDSARSKLDATAHTAERAAVAALPSLRLALAAVGPQLRTSTKFNTPNTECWGGESCRCVTIWELA